MGDVEAAVLALAREFLERDRGKADEGYYGAVAAAFGALRSVAVQSGGDVCPAVVGDQVLGAGVGDDRRFVLSLPTSVHVRDADFQLPRSGGSLGGGQASGVGAGLVPGSGGVRGPNYLRNQQARIRRKVQKEQRAIALAELRGAEAAGMSVRGGVAFGSSDPELAERERKVKLMRLERQQLQEQRKLDKLKSPTTMIEDAMRQVALAAKYAKMANDTKVAAWAADLTSASAESIAKSAGYSSGSSSRDGKSRVQTVASSAGPVDGEDVTGLIDGGVVPASRVRARVVAGGAGGQSFVNSSGKHVKLDGSTYTRTEARDWVQRRAYVQKYNLAGLDLEQVCKASGMSQAEAIKYNEFVKENFVPVPMIGAVKSFERKRDVPVESKKPVKSGWFS